MEEEKHVLIKGNGLQAVGVTPTCKGGHTDEEVLKASRAAVLIPWLDAVINGCTKNVPVQPEYELTAELAIAYA